MLLSQNLLFAIGVVILVWLFVCSFFLWRATLHYQKLTEGVQKGKLGDVLDKILKDISFEGKRIGELAGKIEQLDKEGKFHVQKIGLVKFNPFSDTGGKQSFTLALLDGHDDGFVLSTLHSRDQTRIYTKPVKKGKTRSLGLSKEEKEAIEKAIKQVKK